MKKVNLLSIAISTGSYTDFIKCIMMAANSKSGHYTCVANVHMLVEAHYDRKFGDVVKNAHLITPDGKPLTWALRLLYGIKQERVAGMDLLPDLLMQASLQQLPVYFYGGSEALLDKTKVYLNEHYQNLIVAGLYSPPFRTLTKDEELAIIETINNSGARIVFVVLGCPKQEKWMASMQGRIEAATIGVGGALPVMMGIRQRAPVWMQRGGMEWLYRLGQEPTRLFKRYAVTNSMFLLLLFKEYFRSRMVKQVS